MEALINRGEKINVDGKDYLIRRLDITDVFVAADLFVKLGADIAQFAPVEGQENTALDNKVIGFKILAMIPKVKDELMSFLASLLSIEEADFRKMPPMTLLKMIMALRKSEDIKAFFGEVRDVLRELFPAEATSTESAQNQATN